MDFWGMMVGFTTLALIFYGEKFKTGAYLWAGMLFAIIFALRMGEPMFYMATAGLLGVLAYRTFFAKEDVRDASESDSTNYSRDGSD